MRVPQKYVTLSSLIFVILIFFPALRLPSQTIPSDRTVNWSLSGVRNKVPAPVVEANIMDYGGVADGTTDNSAAWQAALTALNNNPGIIYFPPGNFFFANSLLPTTGVIIQGAGSENTTLTFNLGGSGHLINVNGNATAVFSGFALDANKGDQQIEVADASSFAIGDYIRIAQDDEDLIFSSWAIGTVGQIIRIAGINQNMVSLDGELRRSYLLTDNPTVQKLNPVTHVGVESVKIIREDETNPSQTNNIRFNYAAHCWVTGVESVNTNFAHVLINASNNITIRGNYMHHAFNYGGGGRAYGVMIQQTGNESRVEDNVFEHLRHSMIVQSGANGNVFGYNYSFDPFWTGTSFPSNAAGDMVCHGNYTYANLFEGNIAQQGVMDSSHGLNGPLNTYFRCREETYGLILVENASDRQNFVGNEITNALGNYLFWASDHLLHGNNLRGSIQPNGTNSLPDISYYLSGRPNFMAPSYPFPSIGIPNVINTGSIPAQDRVTAGGTYTVSQPTLGPLPVELTNFTASLSPPKAVQLNWQTASEINHDYFNLERSTDGRTFTTIKTVQNRDLAISTTIKNYAYLDKKPNTGINYYRLAQIDRDRSVEYSAVVSVMVDDNSVNLYPSFVEEQLTVELGPSRLYPITMSIHNLQGQQVFSMPLLNDVNTIPLTFLNPGSYWVTISQQEQIVGTQWMQKL